MAGLSKSLWFAAALVALPLPASAQEMCAALQRIAAAAREPVPFASLEASGAALLPNYHYCRVETGTPQRAGAVLCHAQLAPKTLMAETVGAQVHDCLGAVPVAAPDDAIQAGLYYRTDQLWIRVTSSCDERCHVGRVASLVIRRRREGDTTPPS